MFASWNVLSQMICRLWMSDVHHSIPYKLALTVLSFYMLAMQLFSYFLVGILYAVFSIAI